MTTTDDNGASQMLSEYFHLPHLTQILLVCDNFVCLLLLTPYQVVEYHTQQGLMEPPYQRRVN